MKKIIVLFVILLLFIGGSPAMAQTPDRATWLWNPWMFYDSPESTLVFLQQKKVSTVFVQIDSDIPRTKYHAFLTGAHKANIKVFALDGAPNWGNTTGAKAKNKFKNWLANYQKTAPATAKLDGIHVDIEPYGLPEWETKRAATVRGFQNVLTELAAFSKTQKLQFEADIPFWFDEITYNNPTYGKGNLAEWTIKNTDGVALMSYRDTAQAIIDISSKEMAWGKTYGKKVRVGVETMESKEHPFISFHEEGEQAMERALVDVNTAFRGYSSFAGVSVHHVGSWMNMRP
ncbi:amidase [Chryseomicrobium palamuruense]